MLSRAGPFDVPQTRDIAWRSCAWTAAKKRSTAPIEVLAPGELSITDVEGGAEAHAAVPASITASINFFIAKKLYSGRLCEQATSVFM